MATSPEKDGHTAMVPNMLLSQVDEISSATLTTSEGKGDSTVGKKIGRGKIGMLCAVRELETGAVKVSRRKWVVVCCCE